MISEHVISMPDKWEYPWFAAWDLAVHTIAFSTVDIDFAKQQLDLLLGEVYQHPSGQIPAYEWNFSDVNPPVHAWAAMFLYRTEQTLRGNTDLEFLSIVGYHHPAVSSRSSRRSDPRKDCKKGWSSVSLSVVLSLTGFPS